MVEPHRVFNVGDRVVNWRASRHNPTVGEILAVYSRGKVRVRWADGAERLRAVATLRKAETP